MAETLEQPDLFSPAIVHKRKGREALCGLAIERARAEFEAARRIDPYLADIEILSQAAQVLVELRVDPRSRLPGLVRAWERLQQLAGTLPRAVRAEVETLICDRVMSLLPAGFSGFVDPKRERLHVGYCWLVLGDPARAHRSLLQHLTSRPDDTRPRLWGYFADAAYLLGRAEESDSGYLRALFTDPQAVDLERLQNPDLRRVAADLRRQHPEETAHALLPVEGWLQGVLHVPRPSRDRWLTRVVRERRYDHSAELLLYPAQRYHQFALCLYVDQSGSHGDIAFDARQEMQRLDRDLFHRYLAALA